MSALPQTLGIRQCMIAAVLDRHLAMQHAAVGVVLTWPSIFVAANKIALYQSCNIRARNAALESWSEWWSLLEGGQRRLPPSAFVRSAASSSFAQAPQLAQATVTDSRHSELLRHVATAASGTS
jgi:hypothetical protein